MNKVFPHLDGSLKKAIKPQLEQEINTNKRISQSFFSWLGKEEL
jgi:hypothetical protein